jgi:hypothetical protein
MKRDELSGAGELDANQPRESLIARDELSRPPDASGPGLADLRGAGDDSAAVRARPR